jgi:uncharacterized protein YecE (DUF72 family)
VILCYIAAIFPLKRTTLEAVKVGCCGFGMAQNAYFETFSCVEVQHTFYQPPTLKTLSKWRDSAPSDFEFALKAWQLITHSSSSPTFRRITKKLSSDALGQAGAFRNTNVVKEALDVTLACAEVLRAKALLFQCPASFNQTAGHIENMRQFFSDMARPKGMHLYWEPRGDWDDETISKLCNELHLFRALDPFLVVPVPLERGYFRLHGKGGWRYGFTEKDQEWLAGRVIEQLAKGKSYVFFNNVKMVDDASEFQQRLCALR